MKRIFASALVTLLVIGCAASAYAQDKVVKKIIETGTTDNRTMVHADWLANRIGGRIVGSPALTHAEAWVKEQFESWGLEVLVQEATEAQVGFNRGPWWGRMLSAKTRTVPGTAGEVVRQPGGPSPSPLKTR